MGAPGDTSRDLRRGNSFCDFDCYVVLLLNRSLFSLAGIIRGCILCLPCVPTAFNMDSRSPYANVRIKSPALMRKMLNRFEADELAKIFSLKTNNQSKSVIVKHIMDQQLVRGPFTRAKIPAPYAHALFVGREEKFCAFAGSKPYFLFTPHF